MGTENSAAPNVSQKVPTMAGQMPPSVMLFFGIPKMNSAEIEGAPRHTITPKMARVTPSGGHEARARDELRDALDGPSAAYPRLPAHRRHL